MTDGFKESYLVKPVHSIERESFQKIAPKTPKTETLESHHKKRRK